MTNPGNDPAKTYLWCDNCRRSFRHADAPDTACPVCSREMRATGKMNALLRGLMATEMTAPDMRTKHRQLIRLIWTRNGMGEQYYRVLAPDMPYNRFEAAVTDLLCQGALDGWVRFILPPAPTNVEAEYRLEFIDEERFVVELELLVASLAKS